MRLFYKFISRRMMNKHSNIPFIDSPTAIKIDELLMSDTIGYSIDQLIEVAGLSVALAIDDCINTSDGWKGTKRILSINGPGSNET